MKCCCLWALYFSHISSISTQIISMNISVQLGFWFTQSEGKTWTLLYPELDLKWRQKLWSLFGGDLVAWCITCVIALVTRNLTPMMIYFPIRHQGSWQDWSNHYRSQKIEKKTKWSDRAQEQVWTDFGSLAARTTTSAGWTTPDRRWTSHHRFCHHCNHHLSCHLFSHQTHDIQVRNTNWDWFNARNYCR